MTNMTIKSIEEYIDDRIILLIEEKKSFDYIIKYFKSKKEKYEIDEDYMSLSEIILKLNWNVLNSRSRFLRVYVLHSTKRISDIDWIIKNREKFNISDYKIFKLSQLRNKLSLY